MLSVQRNEGNYCSEFYKYVKGRKGNREITTAIKDHNVTIITANVLNSYYASLFCCDHGNKISQPGENFIINTKVIRKRLAKLWRNKSVGPDEVPGEILKLDGVAMTPFLPKLLEIS